MTDTRTQSTSSFSLLFNAINDMGSDCKLSKDEITQKLSAVFKEVPVIKDFDVLLTLAINHRNLAAFNWLCDSVSYHPAYKVTISHISKATDLLVRTADHGEESKDIQLNIVRSMMDACLEYNKNYRYFDSTLAEYDYQNIQLKIEFNIGFLEKTILYQNYYCFDQIFKSLNKDNNLFTRLRSILKNKEYYFLIIDRLIMRHNIMESSVFIQLMGAEAALLSLEKNHFELTLKLLEHKHLSGKDFKNEFLTILFKKQKNKEISFEVFSKILNSLKKFAKIYDPENYYYNRLNAEAWGLAIELSNISILESLLEFKFEWPEDSIFALYTRSGVAIDKYNKRLTNSDTVIFVINEIAKERKKINKEEVNFAIQSNSLPFLKQLIATYDNAKKHIDQSSLSLAASHGSSEVLDFLITQLDIPVNKNSYVSKPHCPALKVAIEKGHIDIVKLLIGKGAETTLEALKIATLHQSKDIKLRKYIRIRWYIACILAIHANKFQDAAIASINLDEEDKLDLVRLFENRQSLMIRLVGEGIYKKAFQISRTPSEQKQVELKPLPEPSAPNLSNSDTINNISTTTSVSLVPFLTYPKIMSEISGFLLEPETKSSSSLALIQENKMEEIFEFEPGAPDLTPHSTSNIFSFFQDEKSNEEKFQKMAHQLLDICTLDANFWIGNENLQKQLQQFCFQKLGSLEVKKDAFGFR